MLAVALAFAGLGTAVGMHSFLLVPITLGLTIPVVFRRTHPVGAFAVVIAVGALQVIFDLRPAAPDLAILVLLYTLAAYTTRRISIIGLSICLLGSAAELLYTHEIRDAAAELAANRGDCVRRPVADRLAARRLDAVPPRLLRQPGGAGSQAGTGPRRSGQDGRFG